MLVFYFVYIVLILGITTTAILSRQGKCLEKHGTKGEPVKCFCPCSMKDRDSSKMYCKRCEHYVKVDPDKFVRDSRVQISN